ncbi:hypothetical protein PR048_003529 [Dryococelus australis]|uniref:Uncharacterized protein n=1 Tax=Dryococelus australis TaxID=614101 RepID=A0ABQ9INB5_9NEOP|nr:hypothetical protein PR048_003529 [Dryococelus australis]
MFGLIGDEGMEPTNHYGMTSPNHHVGARTAPLVIGASDREEAREGICPAVANRRLNQPTATWARGRGCVVVRLLAFRLGEPGSISGGVATGFSHVAIVLDNAAGRRVFPGISRFPRPCIPALLHTSLHLHQLSRSLHSSPEGNNGQSHTKVPRACGRRHIRTQPETAFTRGKIHAKSVQNVTLILISCEDIVCETDLERN